MSRDSNASVHCESVGTGWTDEAEVGDTPTPISVNVTSGALLDNTTLAVRVPSTDGVNVM
jgi:hypothetical protein